VVQLYTEQLLGSVTTYDLNLRGFGRVHLKAGEKRRIELSMPVKRLEIISRDGVRRVEPGDFQVSLGASSVDLRLKSRFSVLP
jgi:beta-glucosidase